MNNNKTNMEYGIWAHRMLDQTNPTITTVYPGGSAKYNFEVYEEFGPEQTIFNESLNGKNQN